MFYCQIRLERSMNNFSIAIFTEIFVTVKGKQTLKKTLGRLQAIAATQRAGQTFKKTGN